MITIADVFGDDIKQRNFKLLFTGLGVLVVTFVVLQLVSNSSPTGNSILAGALTAANDSGSEEDVFALDKHQKFDLFINVLKLKTLNKTEKKLQYAEKVAKIDNLVKLSKNEFLTAGWSELVECIEAESCTDEHYVFMRTLFKEAESLKKSSSFFSFKREDKTLEKLIINILDLKLAAERHNIVMRSKLVTETNSQITNYASVEVKDIWEQLVDCNFSCDEYDKLLLLIAETYFENEL